MQSVISRLIADIDKHTNDIWVKEPDDIFRLKKGVITSGAGIHGQYFTVMVMLSGEVRALGIHIFSDLLELARDGSFTLEQLRLMTRKMLAVDLGVISYFGLPDFGVLLERFCEHLNDLENLNEYTLLCEKLFLLANRYQLWLHQIFPWKLMSMFPKRTTEEIAADTCRLKEIEE